MVADDQGAGASAEQCDDQQHEHPQRHTHCDEHERAHEHHLGDRRGASH
jgi:hypothetical protein